MDKGELCRSREQGVYLMMNGDLILVTAPVPSSWSLFLLRRSDCSGNGYGSVGCRLSWRLIGTEHVANVHGCGR